MLGEATDHVTQAEVNQSEVDQMNAALTQASAAQNAGKRGADPATRAAGLTDLLAQVPGTGGLIQEAVQLQADSDAQAAENEKTTSSSSGYNTSYAPYGNEYGGARANEPGQQTFQGPPKPAVPGTNIDPKQAIAKIYPLLLFRDKVVRTIAGIVSKIPGLEQFIETISEKVTLFIMGLLAPYVKPIIAAATNGLKQGSGTVVNASAKQQYLVWTDPQSTDPTHSMLSKDHFSNVLNNPAGQVASAILKYVAPRVIYGWDHPEVPEQEILDDIGRVFHHPAIRDQNIEVHREMFTVVERWARSRPHNAPDLNQILSSDSVKAGHNHTVLDLQQSTQGLQNQLQQLGTSSHSATAGGPLANFLGGGRRDVDWESEASGQQGSYGAYGQSSYGQQSQQPASFASGDVNAYPTAYQQGYEAPYDPSQQQQYGEAQQGFQPGYQQGEYGGQEQHQRYGYGQGGYNQY